MFLNYLKTAWRNLLRHKLFSFISVVGLAVGMAVCLTILLFVKDELSYDRFHENKDRIYRLTTQNGLADLHFASTSAPLGPVLATQVPDIEAVARLFARSASIMRLGEGSKGEAERFEESNFYHADSTIFDILTFAFLVGAPEKALTAPGSLVMSEEMAIKYFGEHWRAADIIGQQIEVEGQFPFQVTGVFRDWPHQSHLEISFLASFENMYEMNGENVGQNLRLNWLYNPFQYYVLLREGVSEAVVEAQFPNFLKEHTPDYYADKNELQLQPLNEIYLYSDGIISAAGRNGDINLLWLFAAIALFTLLIACVNFINLSTVRSIKRAREVGMRKVLGAQRWQLISQFLGESAVVSVLGLGGALLLVWLFLPVLNGLTDKELAFFDLAQPQILWGMLGVWVISGLLAGAYPALFVSRFRPVVSLKGKVSEQVGGNVWLRRSLVVFQFCISIALITASLILYQQLDFLRNKPLGFAKEQMVSLPLFSSNRNLLLGGGMTPELRGRLTAFEDELLKAPQINAITQASHLPGMGAVYRNVIPEGATQQDQIFVPNIAVDYDFIESVGLEVVSGRGFSRSFGTDHTNAFVVNEQAVKQFDWGTPEEAIGRPLEREGKQGTVIGVVKDFHFASLQQPIQALVMDVAPMLFTNFLVRMEGDTPREAMQRLEDAWKVHFPERAFTYNFLDEQIGQMYRQQEQLGQLTGYFAFLAVLISCLGLFGLASFIVTQRMREMGIRRVLGASTRHLLGLLSKEYVLLLAVAFVLATPITYFLMKDWLSEFAYRIELGVGVFLLGGLLAFLIAGMTVSYQSIRAVRVNPAQVLKEE